ncbi:MAG: BspA family leucine-rich repeat surface protein [Ekhidna sp.]|nr:BspA family leucine-rich repeat surface protein [Ekhidna sp.]
MFPRIRFGETNGVGSIIASTMAATQIRTIEKWGDIQWTSMRNAFANCDNLTFNATDVPDLSNVTDMFGMLIRANFSGDISEWDVSKVTNMHTMFALSSFNGDLSRWDVNKVTNMFAMFNKSSFNGDLSEWDISSVKNINSMFSGNTSMSSENYDKLLIGWSTLNEVAGETKIPKNIIFGSPDKYSCRGKAGRDALTGTHSWTIRDDELISIRTEAATLPEVTSQCIASLTPPTAKSSCTMGEGVTVTAAHDVSNFPITESSLITWTYTHNSKSIVQTQTVTITEDTTPPTVTGSLAPVTAQCPINAENELTEPDAPADNCGGTVNVAIKDDTEFPIQAGTTTITWVYIDESGNMSEQTQDVTIADTMKPRVTDLNAITAACSLAEDDLTIPKANDVCDGEIMGAHNVTDFPITENASITWTYTDKADNTATQTQQVIVDNTPPTVTGNLNAITAQCSLTETDITFPTANDACDGEITATHDVANFPITSKTTITWTYTDSEGNTATQTQEVNIDDTMPPKVTGTLNAITAACSLEENNLPIPTANDACDGEITATTDVSFPITANAAITWTYTDAAGNTATQTQEVTITPCVLSAEEEASEAVVFPNPSGRYVEVQSPVESPVRILSVGGELVLKGTTNTRIDAASLRSGLYLVQLPDGRLLKFVKK